MFLSAANDFQNIFFLLCDLLPIYTWLYLPAVSFFSPYKASKFEQEQTNMNMLLLCLLRTHGEQYHLALI